VFFWQALFATDNINKNFRRFGEILRAQSKDGDMMMMIEMKLNHGKRR
jgi:hypothetical protein